MEVLDVKTLPNGDEEWTIDLTKQEREMIKKEKGWKRLTMPRIQSWFVETLEKKLTMEKYRQMLNSLVYKTLFFSTEPMDVEDIEKAIIESGEFPFDDKNSLIDNNNVKEEIEKSIELFLEANPFLWIISDDSYILVPEEDILRDWYLFNSGIKLSEMHEYPVDILEIQEEIQSADQIDEFLDDDIPYRRLLAAVMAKKKFKQDNEPLLNDLFKNDPDQLVRFGSLNQLMADQKMSQDKIDLIKEGLSDQNIKIKLASFRSLEDALSKPLLKDQANEVIGLMAGLLDTSLEFNALWRLILSGKRKELIPHLLKYLESKYSELDTEEYQEIKEKINSLLSTGSRIPKNIREEIKIYCKSDNITASCKNSFFMIDVGMVQQYFSVFKLCRLLY